MKSKNEKTGNPFQFGVVIDDTAFCNRKKEIAFLKKQIENGYSTWLFSPRRFGKTSLVEKVFREISSTTCIYVDLYNIKSLDDFGRKYSAILARELFNWKDEIRNLTKRLSENFRHLSPGVSFDEFGNPGFSLKVNKIEQQADIETILEVPNNLSRKRKQPVCIAFDEFQEINRIEAFLLNWMRSSFQRHQNVCYIFLGSKQSMMENIFASAQSPFYEFAVKMNLSVIDHTELFNFIQEKFNNYNLPIKDHTIRSILETSECQPHYTQFFASVVFDLIRSGHDQDAEGFRETWLHRVMYSQADIFQDIYDQLTNTQRTALLAISKTGGIGIYSDEARERYGLPVSSSLTEALKALQKKTLIYKAGEQYKFSNPVLREWLLTL
ncbi:MAG: ATP-binding protein [Bacteroidales bacterium]|nr:ATP-binding protein [Bacteroidales bacterium]